MPKAKFEHEFEDLSGSALPEELEVDISEGGITPKAGGQQELELSEENVEKDKDDKDDKDGKKDDDAEDQGRPDPTAIAAFDATRQLEQQVGQTAQVIVNKIYALEKAINEKDAGQRVEQIKGQITDLKSKLKAAKESGDTDTEVDLLEQMADLKAELKITPVATAADDQTEDAPAQQPKYSKATIDWANRNKWFFGSENPEAKTYAVFLEGKLRSEGHDITSKEFYDELDSRLAKAYPSLAKPKNGDDDADDPLKIRKKLPANTAGVSRTTQSNGTSSSKVIITKEDLEQMRLFKLDPSNPEHLKQWAREKRAGGN